MNLIRVTKEFYFETAHALYGYDGKCKNIHGHSYKLAVTIIGVPNLEKNHPKNGMVLDFGELKKIVKSEIIELFDHATIFNQNTPHLALAETLEKTGQRVILVPYQPTSEMMLLDISEKIKEKLPAEVKLHSLRLYETNTSYAEWFATDQK
jgi:6-pyruvoyltetrahydropterin/6-carboxytetrahydropterin synthase